MGKLVIQIDEGFVAEKEKDNMGRDEQPTIGVNPIYEVKGYFYNLLHHQI